jgi:hypothetical protein
LIGGVAGRPQREATFAELLHPGASGPSACTIEMEGGKMRIRLQDRSGPDVTVLSNSFWRRAGS